MAKKKTGGFVPPPEVPDERKCIKIYIPNDVYDRGAFWGALWELTFSYNWQSFSEGQSRLMADLWRDIWTEAYERSNGVNCCNEQPVLHRFDPVTGYPQVSYDNGTSWTSDPAGIQNQIQLYPPPVHEGSSNTKCDAATNASEHMNELIASTGENLSTASDIFALAVGVAEAILALFLIIVSAGTLTAPVTAVATAIWAAATSLFALGIDAYNAYWTSDKQDAILCALYCNIGENGQFTEAQYQNFRTQIKSQLPASPALDIIMTAVNAGGAVGLSQMASYGNAAMADCSSCTACAPCVEQWNWPTSAFGANSTVVKDTELGTITAQAWDAGNGFFYWGFGSTKCCNVTVEVTEGTPDFAFRGVIACPDLPEFSWYVENEDWTPETTGISNVNAFDVLVRATSAFTAKVTFNE